MSLRVFVFSDGEVVVRDKEDATAHNLASYSSWDNFAVHAPNEWLHLPVTAYSQDGSLMRDDEEKK